MILPVYSKLDQSDISAKGIQSIVKEFEKQQT
jgi:hypothetical protein